MTKLHGAARRRGRPAICLLGLFASAMLGGCPSQTVDPAILGPLADLLPAPDGGNPGIVAGASVDDANTDPDAATHSLGILEAVTERDGSVVIAIPRGAARGGVQVLTPPTHGTIAEAGADAAGNALIEYRPAAGFTGMDEFSYGLADVGDAAGIVRVGVAPKLRFTAQPEYSHEQLRVRVEAHTVDGSPLPSGTLQWDVDGREYSGAAASLRELIVVVGPLPMHEVRLALTLAGMTAALSIPAEGELEIAQLAVPPRIAGRVMDEFGAAAGLRNVRGIGQREDFATTTDLNGRFELFVSPEWEGRLLVDEPSRICLPDARMFSYVTSNYFSQDFTIRSSNAPSPPPTAQPLAIQLEEDQASEIVLSGTAADGGDAPESLEIVVLPQHGGLHLPASGTQVGPEQLPFTLAGDRTRIEYRPARDYYGPDRFEYRARAGESRGENAVVTIAVTPLNDAPRLTIEGSTQLVGRPNEESSLLVSALDVDAIGAELQWSVSPAPAHGQVVFMQPTSESSQTVEVRFVPNAGFSGDDHFGIRCIDAAGAMDLATVAVFYTTDELVARAGPDQDVASFSMTTLNGSGSITPAGATYEWRQVSGPGVVLEDANSPVARFRAPATLTTASLEFELKVRAGGESSVDSVKITARYGKQALLYAAHAALDRLWSVRTGFALQDGRTLYGYATSQSLESSISFWGDEAGGLCDSPLWDFQNRDGIAGALTAFLNAYGATQNREYLRRAEALGDALLAAQEGLNGGWFQDAAYIDGQWRNVGVWGSWGNRRHTPESIQDAITLDDSTSQSCALALLRLYEVSNQSRFLAGAKRFGDLLVGLRDVRYDGIQPYRNGGMPQIIPIERAFVVDINQNTDPRNPDGPYMAGMTLNDSAMPHAIIFLSELHRVTGQASYLEAVRLNIDFLLERHAAYGYRGWAQQYHWLDGRICWGRHKEPPGFVTCETNIVYALLLARARENDAERKTRIENSLQRYLDWLREDVARPSGYADQVWRYYNHDANAGPLNSVLFAANYQRWFGEEHESQAAGGQPWRGRFDLSWNDRLLGAGNRIDWLRAQPYVNSAPSLPINVTPAAWQASFETQDPKGAWPQNYNVNGTQRQGLGTASTANRIQGLIKRFGEVSGVLTDADADGFSDSTEAAAGTDPRDSASHP